MVVISDSGLLVVGVSAVGQLPLAHFFTSLVTGIKVVSGLPSSIITPGSVEPKLSSIVVSLSIVSLVVVCSSSFSGNVSSCLGLVVESIVSTS